MKKSLFLSALLLSSLAVASDYKYEISPLIGYNSAEGNLGINDNGYVTGGLELQLNAADSQVSPEISLFYAPDVNYKSSGTTDIMRIMANGVYTFQKRDVITPFVKAGFGMETFTTNRESNEDRPFVDMGIGLKADVTQNISLKVEAIYMLKPTFSHAGSADSNLLTLFGVNYAFGETKSSNVYQAKTPQEEMQTQTQRAKEEVIPEPEEVVSEPISEPLVTSVVVKQESQNKYETIESVNLHIKFDYKSTKISEKSLENIKEFANLLKKNPEYSCKIIGYSDDIGSKGYNLKLSKQRADSVVDALVKEGVAQSQLIAIGAGEANPIADNATEDGRAKNRRIEAAIIK